MPRFHGDMPRMAPFDEKNLLNRAPGYDTVAPWRPGAPGHHARAAQSPALTPRQPIPWRWRLLAFIFLPDAIHLLVGSPVETDATSVSYRLHRRITEHLFPQHHRAAPYGQAAQLPEPRLPSAGASPTPATTGTEKTQSVRSLPQKARLRRKRALDARRLWRPVDDSPQHVLHHAVGLFIGHFHHLPIYRRYAWHPQQWYWSSYHEYNDPDPQPRPGIPLCFPLRPDPRRPWLNTHGEPAPLTEMEFRMASERRWRAALARLADIARYAPSPNTRQKYRALYRHACTQPPPLSKLYGPNDPLDNLPPAPPEEDWNEEDAS